MKIRVISDLHIDVNSDHCLNLKDKDVFTVIAGDTSGDPELTEKWIKKNVKNGIFIAGNHLVYNKKEKNISDLRKYLHEKFPFDSNITFLDNEFGPLSKEVDGVIFVGTTLYTDYKYPGKMIFPKNFNKETIFNFNLSKSWTMMNDFRYGKVEGRDMTPYDYVRWFKSSFENIKKTVEDNEKQEHPKPIVLITHHGMSPKCISGHYVDSDTNASYISNLESFIKKHNSIKCVISGHVHNQTIFDIKRKDGSVCKYIVNPRGYCFRCEDIPGFNEDTFIDTETWEVSKGEKSKSRILKEKRREEEYKKRLENIMCFI